MIFSTEVNQKLLSIITEMNSCRWLFTKNPETDFSRKKKWAFEEIMKFNGIASNLTMLPKCDEFDEWVNVTLTRKQTNEVKENLEKYRMIRREFLLIILICILIRFTRWK